MEQCLVCLSLRHLLRPLQLALWEQQVLQMTIFPPEVGSSPLLTPVNPQASWIITGQINGQSCRHISLQAPVVMEGSARPLVLCGVKTNLEECTSGRSDYKRL